MQIEEFIKLGCIGCGYHDFASTGPIEVDGPTEITCTRCERTYDRNTIGELDSLEWERQYKEEHGEVFEEPRQTRYENEQQFIQQFEEAVDGPSS